MLQNRPIFLSLMPFLYKINIRSAQWRKRIPSNHQLLQLVLKTQHKTQIQKERKRSLKKCFYKCGDKKNWLQSVLGSTGILSDGR